MEMCKREGCRNVSYLSLCYLHSSWLKNTTGTVAIPTHFYKIITRCDGSKTPYYETPNCQGRLDVISFILPHSAKSICKVSSVFCVIIKIDRYCFTRCMVGYHNLFETTCCVPVVFCTSEEIIVDTRTLKLKARKLWRAIIGIKKTLISTNEWINQSMVLLFHRIRPLRNIWWITWPLFETLNCWQVLISSAVFALRSRRESKLFPL